MFETKIEKKYLPIIPLLGPFLLFGALLAANHSLELWLFSLIALFLVWRYQQKGFFYSLGLFLLVALLRQSSTSFHLWELGLESSVLIAMLVTKECFSTVEDFLTSLHLEIKQEKKERASLYDEQQRRVFDLEQEKQVLLDKLTHIEEKSGLLNVEKKDLEKLCHTLRASSTLAENFKESLMQELAEEKRNCILKEQAIQEQLQLIEKLKESKKLKEENALLLQKLNKERVNHHQSEVVQDVHLQLYQKEKKKAEEAYQLIAIKDMEQQNLHEVIENHKKEITSLSQNLEKAYRELESVKEKFPTKEIMDSSKVAKEYASLKEKYEEKLELLKHSQDRLKELSQMEGAYLQLKKQFLDKDSLLHQTRKELFSMETKLLTFEKEKELSSHGFTDLESLEEENKELQELVTQLFNQAAQTKPF